MYGRIVARNKAKVCAKKVAMNLEKGRQEKEQGTRQEIMQVK